MTPLQRCIITNLRVRCLVQLPLFTLAALLLPRTDLAEPDTAAHLQRIIDNQETP